MSDQLQIFDDTTRSDLKPRLKCSNDETCKAEADEHLETCPVEADLKATFGF